MSSLFSNLEKRLEPIVGILVELERLESRGYLHSFETVDLMDRLQEVDADLFSWKAILYRLGSEYDAIRREVIAERKARFETKYLLLGLIARYLRPSTGFSGVEIVTGDRILESLLIHSSREKKICTRKHGSFLQDSEDHESETQESVLNIDPELRGHHICVVAALARICHKYETSIHGSTDCSDLLEKLPSGDISIGCIGLNSYLCDPQTVEKTTILLGIKHRAIGEVFRMNRGTEKCNKLYVSENSEGAFIASNPTFRHRLDQTIGNKGVSVEHTDSHFASLSMAIANGGAVLLPEPLSGLLDLLGFDPVLIPQPDVTCVLAANDEFLDANRKCVNDLCNSIDYEAVVTNKDPLPYLIEMVQSSKEIVERTVSSL